MFSCMKRPKKKNFKTISKLFKQHLYKNDSVTSNCSTTRHSEDAMNSKERSEPLLRAERDKLNNAAPSAASEREMKEQHAAEECERLPVLVLERQEDLTAEEWSCREHVTEVDWSYITGFRAFFHAVCVCVSGHNIYHHTHTTPSRHWPHHDITWLLPRSMSPPAVSCPPAFLSPPSSSLMELCFSGCAQINGLSVGISLIQPWITLVPLSRRGFILERGQLEDSYSSQRPRWRVFKCVDVHGPTGWTLSDNSFIVSLQNVCFQIQGDDSHG